MRKSNILGALAALALVLAPVTLSAQQQPAQQQAQVEQWMEEARQIGTILSTAAERAMESRALREEQQQLSTEVNAAVLAAHPTIADDMRRIEELQVEAARAYEAGEEATLERLTREFETIDQRIEAAHRRAMETNGLGERLAAFEVRLVEAMKEHEPRAEELIQRQGQLQLQIAAAMQRSAGG